MKRLIAILASLAFLLLVGANQADAQRERIHHIRNEIKRHREAIKKLHEELRQIKQHLQEEGIPYDEGAVEEGGDYEYAPHEYEEEGTVYEGTPETTEPAESGEISQRPHRSEYTLPHGLKERRRKHRREELRKHKQHHKPNAGPEYRTHKPELGPKHRKLPGKRVGPTAGPGRRIGPPDMPRGYKPSIGHKPRKESKPEKGIAKPQREPKRGGGRKKPAGGRR